MPNLDDPNLNPTPGMNIPVPANYPTIPVPSTAPKARPPAITGGVKSSTGSLSAMADAWAKAHPVRFGNALAILPAATPTIVLGNKRVSVPVDGIRYARPTLVYQDKPGVVWKQEGGVEVETWVLVLNDPTRTYTLDDADALAELIQRGLVTDYRVGDLLIGKEPWYDNAKDLPDYSKATVVNWPVEVSTRDARIAGLASDLKEANQNAANGWKAVGRAELQREESEQKIHREWEVFLRNTHTIYIVFIVLLVVVCLLLPTCHPFPWVAR
jgi:hypothetical protein